MATVVADHCVLSAYGFWLPNDPRGSWSEKVFSDALFCAGGPPIKTSSRRSLAEVPHDTFARLAAKAALNRPPVRFNGMQARAIGRGFTAAVELCQYQIFACAILPDHVHLVVARGRMEIATVLGYLKRAATMRLIHEGIHPFAGQSPLPSVWARGNWNQAVSARHLQEAIAYVENNPVKAGLKPQHWSFVKPFHSPTP